MGQELGEREEGLLQFRGPSATRGYFNNPQATRGLISDGWLNSGDYAYIAEGEIYITGRAKDIIIRAGRNIYPQELESELAAVEGIRKGCVVAFGVPDSEQAEERLVIVAETRVTGAEEREQIQARARGITLAVLGVAPDELRLVPPRTILKTSSGKLRRAATRQLYMDGRLGQGAPLWWQLVRLAAGNLPALLRRARRLGGDLAYGFYCYLVFGLIVPPCVVLVLLAPGIDRSRAVAHRGARALLWLTRAGLRIDGLENLPVGQPHIIAANHASYLDVLVLTAVLPPRYAFVAKRELVHKRIPRLVLSALGTLFVERFEVGEALQDFDHTVGALRAGQSLVFFPEGTFTRQPGLRAFRTGAFKLAVEASVPLLPLALRGTRSIIRDTQFFARRGEVGATVLPPLIASGSDWAAIVALRNATRAAILPHCGEPDLESRLAS